MKEHTFKITLSEEWTREDDLTLWQLLAGVDNSLEDEVHNIWNRLNAIKTPS